VGSFEIYQSGDGFRWRLKASNGQIIAVGEAYTTKASAQKGIDSVKRHASEATIKDLTVKA
jgi:uncharacterized protein YegP (UPF0339 family)